VYDVSRGDTFENLNQWLQEVEVYSPCAGKDVVKLLVGNKIDLGRSVERADAEEWARSKGMIFMEASAKTRVGIQEAFTEVVQKVGMVEQSTRHYSHFQTFLSQILDNPVLLANTAKSTKPGGVKVSVQAQQAQGGGCC
jgi:Ras-related protein Rab-18